MSRQFAIRKILGRDLGVVALVAIIGACNAGVGASHALPSSSPEPGPTVAASSSSATATAPALTDVTTLLGAADIDRPLRAGSYRIEDPFDAPFTIAFPTEWTLKALSNGDVSFLNTAVNAGEGAAWVTIDRVDSVFDDPCHGGPITPPVPATVDGIVTALTHMAGFTPGPVSDVVIGGAAGKSVETRNTIDTQTAGCVEGGMLPMWTIRGGGEAATNGISRENFWVVDVDGAPLIIDGTMLSPTPETSRSEIEAIIQSIRFGSAVPAPVPSIASATVTPGSVDIGGRSLYIECRGSGSPTVIFLPGSGGPRTQMRGVEDALLTGPVRVCDYDRAGEGESDPAPNQTDLDVGDDLAALLDAAGIAPPYVLVGQSVGGDEAWLYASKHPAGVAGFLIMNAGFFELDWDALHDVWSDQEIAEERAGSEAGLGSVKQAATPPAGVPYVVMLSTIAQCGSTTDICGRVYPFYEAWARELAGRTKDGRFVSVEAGHEIFLSRPDRVMEEIKGLLDEVR